ncbi:HTH-type transcriptional repressor NsrR (plasmid) [Caballeronia sp. SBC2]|nr:HTH-type transcriptional repressor NsrR [Caballeronia sp. SBC2]
MRSMIVERGSLPFWEQRLIAQRYNLQTSYWIPMRLTDFTDYSLRVLIYAAVHTDELVTIQEISDAFGIPRNHLMKIVHLLGRAGYLTTSRGRRGGLRLGRPATKIIIGEVVRTMEPDFQMVECFNTEGNGCVITAACGLRGVLGSALRAYFDVLDKYTLADLVAERSMLTRLLKGGPAVHPLVHHHRK